VDAGVRPVRHGPMRLQFKSSLLLLASATSAERDVRAHIKPNFNNNLDVRISGSPQSGRILGEYSYRRLGHFQTFLIPAG
jgi:hypothetical protein